MIKSTNTESLEEAIDSDIVSSLQKAVEDSQNKLNLTDDILDKTITYIAGTSEPPKFMESFSIDKLKNITSVAMISQVSRVPGIIKLLNETNSAIMESNELRTMDIEDLVKFSKSLGDELNSILGNARKTMDSLQKMEMPPSSNQKLLDQLLQMSDEEIVAMKEYMASRKKSD